MLIASQEENQKFASTAVAAAATVFCHFWIYYKLNIVLSYIWMNSRLKGLSIESKNTQNGVRTKKLCASEVGRLTWCRGYSVAWNPTPRRSRGCTSHAPAWIPRPGVPEEVPSHATAWLPRPGVPEEPWQLRYTPVFDPKPSQNNHCPPATISSQVSPQDMPQTRHQNHPTINPNSPQK